MFILKNADLLSEARRAKVYRDEVDAMRERAERADKLEMEAQRYREKLADAEFYRVRVEELREDNRVLLETREMLEAQLSRTRQRSDHVLELESELLACKQSINDIALVSCILLIFASACEKCIFCCRREMLQEKKSKSS